jgi:hypothetical protein
MSIPLKSMINFIAFLSRTRSSRYRRLLSAIPIRTNPLPISSTGPHDHTSSSSHSHSVNHNSIPYYHILTRHGSSQIHSSIALHSISNRLLENQPTSLCHATSSRSQIQIPTTKERLGIEMESLRLKSTQSISGSNISSPIVIREIL